MPTANQLLPIFNYSHFLWSFCLGLHPRDSGFICSRGCARGAWIQEPTGNCLKISLECMWRARTYSLTISIKTEVAERQLSNSLPGARGDKAEGSRWVPQQSTNLSSSPSPGQPLSGHFRNFIIFETPVPLSKGVEIGHEIQHLPKGARESRQRMPSHLQPLLRTQG